MEFDRNYIAPTKAARNQKYLHFALLPGDEILIDQLSPEHQKILRSEGSYEKRADEFGVAVGTIRSRLHRAREALSRLRIERDTDASKDDFGLH
ncbi:MAG: hypothetical protein V4559_16130 [Pseudomonadota bacterium]